MSVCGGCGAAAGTRGATVEQSAAGPRHPALMGVSGPGAGSLHPRHHAPGNTISCAYTHLTGVMAGAGRAQEQLRDSEDPARPRLLPAAAARRQVRLRPVRRVQPQGQPQVTPRSR